MSTQSDTKPKDDQKEDKDTRRQRRRSLESRISNTNRDLNTALDELEAQREQIDSIKRVLRRQKMGLPEDDPKDSVVETDKRRAILDRFKQNKK